MSKGVITRAMGTDQRVGAVLAHWTMRVLSSLVLEWGASVHMRTHQMQVPKYRRLTRGCRRCKSFFDLRELQTGRHDVAVDDVVVLLVFMRPFCQWCLLCLNTSCTWMRYFCLGRERGEGLS